MKPTKRLVWGVLAGGVLAVSVAVLHAEWQYGMGFGIDYDQLSCTASAGGNSGQPRETIMDMYAPSGTRVGHCHAVGYGADGQDEAHCWVLKPRTETGTYVCTVQFVLGVDPTQYVNKQWSCDNNNNCYENY